MVVRFCVYYLTSIRYKFITKNTIKFLKRCETAVNSKIKQIATTNLNVLAKYKNVAYLMSLLRGNQLITDGKLLIFNINRNNEIKYSTDQPALSTVDLLLTNK